MDVISDKCMIYDKILNSWFDFSAWFIMIALTASYLRKKKMEVETFMNINFLPSSSSSFCIDCEFCGIFFLLCTRNLLLKILID